MNTVVCGAFLYGSSNCTTAPLHQPNIVRFTPAIVDWIYLQPEALHLHIVGNSHWKCFPWRSLKA